MLKSKRALLKYSRTLVERVLFIIIEGELGGMDGYEPDNGGEVEPGDMDEVDAAVVELLELLRNDNAYDDILYDDAPFVVQFGPNDG